MSVEPRSSGGADETPVSTGEEAGEPAGGRRRLVEIRCGFAEMARQEAEAAAARVVETKLLLDRQAAALALAQAAIDPAAAHEAKDEAHRSFRATVAAARTRGQVEAAAIAWLDQINEINAQGRVAQAQVRHEREAEDALLSQLEKLSDLAEASAAMAEAAMDACRAATAAFEASAAGEDAAVLEASTVPSAVLEAPGASAPAVMSDGSRSAPSTDTSPPQTPAASAPATQTGSRPDEGPPSTDWQVIDLRAPHPQAITLLMRRDSRTMSVLIEQLAGTDSAARRSLQLLLSIFVDSVVAAAIDDACFEFPVGQPFWSQFTPEESREVARGLAVLGFRYDGFGGFADGRVPAQWDLALAVGQAGLLPARVRYWPKPDEAAQLFLGVRVSGDTFIGLRAPALTLGELVTILGRRAESLADLWNDWPRVRPLLLSTSF